MKAATSLPLIAAAAALLLTGCQTGRFPNDYENIVRNYVTPTFKHPDTLEWKTITYPRKGSLWRGFSWFGYADPCWLVDVTLDEKNGSRGYIAYQRTIIIKNDRVIGSFPYQLDTPFIRVSQAVVTVQELSKMPPFEAIVESVDFERPLFASKEEVDIWLKRTDDGKRLTFIFYSANQFLADFARSLHLGQTYSFPQAFDDYLILTGSDRIHEERTVTPVTAHRTLVMSEPLEWSMASSKYPYYAVWFPEGTYHLEAEDSDYWYFRAPEKNGIFISKGTNPKAYSSGAYIDSEGGRMQLIYAFDARFTGQEGKGWHFIDE
jgi:hypothetical protein